MPGYRSYLKRTYLLVYISHFLSSWGDMMWSFGVGIFLVSINPESLQLTAIYGLCMGLSVLLFGALVGDVIDNTPRLKATQVSLVLQNAFVVVCAIVIYVFLVYKSDLLDLWDGANYLVYALIILLSVLSILSSVARKLAVEKDWIIEICGNDPDQLAAMSAVMRSISQVSQVLAPIATGTIMSHAGVEFGALFIGGWNLVSVFIEYFLLWKVYNTVPALQKQKNLKKSEVIRAEQEEKLTSTDKDTDLQNGKNFDESTTDHLNKPENNEGKDFELDLQNNKKRQEHRKCSQIFKSFERLYKGWPLYAKYDIRNAGLALACLYMTVLGLDNVTVGYAKMQGVSELLLGVMMAVAALFGILGTFVYPLLRRKLGLPKSGIFGLSFQITCLSLCVVSVWMPGSIFDLSQGFSPSSKSVATNCTGTPEVDLQYSPLSSNITEPNILLNNSSGKTICGDKTESESPISIWMLLAGIVTARFGLWIADLSISQLFLERVEETERGKVNGVQSSLNQLMDMLKFIMVIIAPYEHMFGLLVIISFIFICLGWLLYAIFLQKEQGYLCCGPVAKVVDENSDDKISQA